MVPPIRRSWPPINWNCISAAAPTATSTHHQAQNGSQDTSSDRETDSGNVGDSDWETVPETDDEDDEHGDVDFDPEETEDEDTDSEVAGHLRADVGEDINIPFATPLIDTDEDVARALVGLANGSEAQREVEIRPGPGLESILDTDSSPGTDRGRGSGPGPEHDRNPGSRNKSVQDSYRRDQIAQIRASFNARRAKAGVKEKGNEPDTSKAKPNSGSNDTFETTRSVQTRNPRNKERYHPYLAPATAPASVSAYTSKRRKSNTRWVCNRRPERDLEPDCERDGGEEEENDDGEEGEQAQRYGSLISCGRDRCLSQSRSQSTGVYPNRPSPRPRYTETERRIIDRHADEERRTMNDGVSPSPHPSSSPISQFSRTESPPETAAARCAFPSCSAHLSGENIYLRKIVSHIFGRNKNVTKKLPDEIWVRYCRKHYQRARYRSGADGKSWADRQCWFVIDALGRMRRLGEVTGFRVRLRKREVRRIEAAASRTSQAPDIASGPAASCDPNSTSTSNSSANKKKPKFKQKRPAVPAPVPKWLIQWIAQREDRMLSFDEVVNLVKMIQRHIENVVLGPNEEVRFPDIEILPSLVDRSSLPSVNSPETSSHCIPGSGFGGERGQDQGPVSGLHYISLVIRSTTGCQIGAQVTKSGHIRRRSYGETAPEYRISLLPVSSYTARLHKPSHRG